MPEMIDCPGCGAANSIHREGCFNCGGLLPGTSREFASTDRVPRGDAPVAALVLGIVTLFFFGIPLIGPALAILGIVFARRSTNGSNPGMATAGLVCSIVGLVLAVAWIPVYIIIWQSLPFVP